MKSRATSSQRLLLGPSVAVPRWCSPFGFLRRSLSSAQHFQLTPAVEKYLKLLKAFALLPLKPICRQKYLFPLDRLFTAALH